MRIVRVRCRCLVHFCGVVVVRFKELRIIELMRIVVVSHFPVPETLRSKSQDPNTSMRLGKGELKRILTRIVNGT